MYVDHETAQVEIDRLRALLLQAALWMLDSGHQDGCSRSRGRPCDCGLHELLNSISEEQA